MSDPRKMPGNQGSALLEGTLTIFLLALIFVGLTQLGITALRQQQLQAGTDYRAWSKAYRAPPQTAVPKVDRDFFGWRATEPASGRSSFRVDVADGI
jgi:hypothetical protein